MHSLKSQRWIWAGLAPVAFVLSSCGLLDVYKNHEKRCKAYCNDDSSSAKKDTPFNFDLSYWNQTTPRSQLDPSTELVPLLRSNPFKLFSNALKTVSEDVTEAKQAIVKTPTTPQIDCLKEVFSAAFKKSDGRNEASLDYGRCVDLAKLEERLNSNRNTTKDGRMKVIELASALHLISLGQVPLTTGGDALHDAQSGLDLLSIIPFRAVRATDLADPAQAQKFKFYMVRGSVQGTAIEKVASSTILKKSWGLLYAGLDENQPLQVEWRPNQNSIRLTGSLATLSAAFQRVSTQTQWDGFGYSREFIFTDFEVSSPQFELNSQLGWSDQATLSGSYFLRVNGDLIEAGGQQSKLFHMKGLGRACVLDVGVVKGFRDGIPEEDPLGQISICSTAN